MRAPLSTSRALSRSVDVSKQKQQVSFFVSEQSVCVEEERERYIKKKKHKQNILNIILICYRKT